MNLNQLIEAMTSAIEKDPGKGLIEVRVVRRSGCLCCNASINEIISFDEDYVMLMIGTAGNG